MRTRIYLAACTPLADEARFARLEKTLPEARREKLSRLRAEGARRLSLGAGLLLVRALRDEGLRPADYRTDGYGKPCFPSLPDFHFSLSHSGEMAMCAVSSRPLGCDIEGPRAVREELAERFFHPLERAALAALPAPAREEAFFRLWTRKESYMKAVGLGFSLPLDSFALTPDGARALLADRQAEPWRFLSFREGAYFCALCAEDADGEIPVVRVCLGGGEKGEGL